MSTVTRILPLLFLFLFCQPALLSAKETSVSQSSRWQTTLKQAEQLLESGNPSAKALEESRSTLARQRDEAQQILENGSIRVRTLQAQLDALGPPPADGKTESEEILNKRSELQKELSTANAPLLNAEEVVRQSDVLIGEFDTLMRKRTASALLARSPSPVFPTRWLPAVEQLGDCLTEIGEDIYITLEDPKVRNTLKDRLPLSGFLIFLGIITLTFLRSLAIQHLTDLFLASREEKVVNWAAISINLTHLVIPIVGAVFLLGGVFLLHLDSFIMKKTISFYPLLAVIFTSGYWLGRSLFSPQRPDLRLIQLEDSEAIAGYRCFLLLGVALSLQVAIELLEIEYEFTAASSAVINLPIILFGSYLLWKLSKVLLAARNNLLKDQTAEDTESAVEANFLLIISQLMKLAAFLAAFFILLGFTELARKLMAPMIVTVALLGLALFLFQVLIGLGAAFLNQGKEKEETSRSLLPIGLTIVIGAMLAPLLALTWGMRWTTIVEIWRTLNEGLQIGDTRLSLDIILVLLFVFIIGLGITRWLQKIFRVAILPRTKLDIGGQNALVTGIGYTGITISVLVAISSAGLNLSSLAILAGALSVGIGFGLQTIASNFVSGVILLIERPIKEGDWIDVSGYSGYVRKISVRSTRIETFDRHDVIIPNADLVAGVVKNMTLTGMTGRILVPVGIAYGSDVEEAQRLLLKAAESHKMVLHYPAPTVLFMGLGESSLDLELRCFIRDVNSMLTVKSDIYFDIYKKLNEAGIEIPFPQRVVTLKEPLKS
ncbi:MAG: DUF3772 domain-containing protein [Desulfopila sp.]|jgi:small-conductance mechanosensitive channel|nr:DUF3772 domain-containing protein [Desulfopila sp.]